MADPRRDEIIDLICKKADEFGIERWELLGGAIAESELDPTAWRQGTWPDWSAGLYQQTVAYADEGDHSASPENVALIQRLYFDPEHACDVAARKYLYWRHDPDVPPLTAWIAYNSPGYYHTPGASPNRANYQRGLDEARAILEAAPVPQKVTFNPDYPAVRQDDDWSCAPTSLTWAMRSLGRMPDDTWIEQDMVALGLVSHADGLLDHTGAGIVHWLQINDAQHYGSDGYGISNAQCPITWDQLVPETNPHPPYPILLGLPQWGLSPSAGHWTGLRGYDAARGMLLLANPATGAVYGQDTMTRPQFEARAGGGATIVRVLHPDLLDAPAPVPTPAPVLPSRADIDAVIASLAVIRSRLPS